MATYTDRLKLIKPSPGACNWDVDWYRNEDICDAIHTQEMLDNGVISGGLMSNGVNLSIDVADVVSLINGSEYTNTGTTITLSVAPVGEVLMNWVYVDDTGALTISSVKPTGDYALLGVVDTDEVSYIRHSDLRRFTSTSISGLTVGNGLVVDNTDPSSPIVAVNSAAQLIHNECINGTFDIWQRELSQVSSGYGSADRWYNQHIGSSKTVSRVFFITGQTEVDNSPSHFMRTVVNSVTGAANMVHSQHRITEVHKFDNRVACVSFWAKADAPKNIAIEGTQVFNSDPLVSGIDPQTVAITTTWQKYIVFIQFPSIAGKALGDLQKTSTGFVFWFDAGTNYNARTNSLGNQSGTFDIAEVEIYPSPVLLATKRPTYQETYWECLPYYQQIPQYLVATGLISVTTIARIAFNVQRDFIRTPNSTVYSATVSGARLYGGGGYADVTSNPGFATNTHGVTNISGTGFASGFACGLYIDGGGFIQIDAEI